MSRITQSKWFVSLLALLFSVLLFLNANTNEKGKVPVSNNATSQVLLNNIPIVLKYDEHKYFVYGYEESVNITLTSANKVLLDTEANQQTRNFTVVADLTKLKLGTHEVPLKIVNLNSGISANIEPKSIFVTIEKKATMEMPVEFSLGNSQLKAGYEIENAKTKIEPDSVKVTAGENSIKNINKIVAVLQASDLIDSNLARDVDVYAIDKEGNRVSAQIDPSQVLVTLVVNAPSKDVPLRYRISGHFAENVKDIKLSPSVSSVAVSGPQKSIDALNVIDIDIDVNGITQKTKKVVKIPVADDLTAKPANVEVVIEPILEDKNKSSQKKDSSETKTEPSEKTQTSSKSSESKEESHSTSESESSAEESSSRE